jgi:hypothetical protein
MYKKLTIIHSFKMQKERVNKKSIKNLSRVQKEKDGKGER